MKKPPRANDAKLTRYRGIAWWVEHGTDMIVIADLPIAKWNSRTGVETAQRAIDLYVKAWEGGTEYGQAKARGDIRRALGLV